MRLLPIAAALLLVACKGNESSATLDRSEVAPSASLQSKVAAVTGGVMGERDMTAAAPPPTEANAQAGSGSTTDLPGSAAADIAPTMVIRNGQASVEVAKLDPAIVKVRQLAAQLGGYIANSSMSSGRDQIRSAVLEIRMPAQRFDQAINGLNTLGKVESVNATAEDVGEEYVDITARVTNAHRLEERLIDLLATRTGKLQDVLSVERELARVREEIERYEGRLRYLKSRVATSTLSVTIHEPAPLLGDGPGQHPILEGIRQAWRNFVSFIAGSIALLGILVPLAAIAFGGWVVYRKVRGKSG
jgi:hypothetical protein